MHGDFTDLLTTLLKAERIRRKVCSQLKEAKDLLRTAQKDVFSVCADLRHTEKRRDKARSKNDEHAAVDSEGYEAHYLRKMEHLNKKQRVLLGDVHGLETRLQSVLQALNADEPRMFRAAQSFVRNVRRMDPTESVCSRDFRLAIRSIADVGRILLRARRTTSLASLPPDRAALELQTQVNLDISPRDQIHTIEWAYRKFIQWFYRQTEPTMIENDMLEAEEAVSGSNQQEGSEDADLKFSPNAREALLQKASEAREEVEMADDWLTTGVRQSYRTERRKHFLTYAYEGRQDDIAPKDPYDREYCEKFEEATERVRSADQALMNVRNRLLEAKVPDPKERELFGLLDDSVDGFTGSEQSTAQRTRAYHAAESSPRIRRWVQNVGGLAHVSSSEPRTIASNMRSSVRCGISQIAPMASSQELIVRWGPERVVLEQEAEQARAE